MKNFQNLALAFVLVSINLMLIGCGSEQAMSSKIPAGEPVASGSGETVGKAGSTSRFTILNEHLYTLSKGRIQSFHLANPENLSVDGTVRVATDIETITNDGARLYVGAETAMYIYSVAIPARPELLGRHAHQQACDPVVTSGNFAFVTLRNQLGISRCSGRTNTLEVIDISKPERPRRVQEIQMHHPSGLGISKDRLFVCDGDAGLVEFDISNPTETRELSRAENEVCADVIALEKTLITTSAEGISQYDLSDEKFGFLSRISAQK